ncbi:hypothetical protein LU673_25435 [Pseudomonas alloputida]|nr:hypothetical protein [Pseudomonas alloputida]MCE0923320.1 hypothetical protein [Pseudomonas alloputida]
MKIRQYRVRFADGRTSTVLDMEGEPPETLIPGLVAKFAPGYVLEVIPV